MFGRGVRIWTIGWTDDKWTDSQMDGKYMNGQMGGWMDG